MKPARLLAIALVSASLTAGIARADGTPPGEPAPTPAAPAAPAATAASPEEKSGANVSVRIGHDDEDDKDPIAVLNRMPPDVRQKLTPEQIEQITRRAQESRDSGARWATEILVPGFFFATILGIVIAVVVARQRRERLLHETLRAMIEKGAEIPDALLLGDKKKPNDRRRGVVLACLGLGLTAFLYVVDKGHDGAWGFGLVPLLLGVGYLVAWAVEKRDPTA